LRAFNVMSQDIGDDTASGTAVWIGDICDGLPWRVVWKDVIAPKPYPREFRDDVRALLGTVILA